MADEPELQRGMTGEWVPYLQQLLQQHGYWTGNIDGEFGDGLEQAVVEFQQATGLTADGVVRPDTWAALTGESGYGGESQYGSEYQVEQGDASFEQAWEPAAEAGGAGEAAAPKGEWFTNDEIDDPETEEAPAPELDEVEASS